MDFVQQISQSLQGLLNIYNCENVQNEGRLVHLLHDSEEFRVNVLETAGLQRKKMLNVSVAGKDAFQVDPLSLDVDPYVEKDMDSVQFIFP